jgi:hypothetical protein
VAPRISFTDTLNMAKRLTASSLAALALASLASASGQSVPAFLASPAKNAASGVEALRLSGSTAGLKIACDNSQTGISAARAARSCEAKVVAKATTYKDSRILTWTLDLQASDSNADSADFNAQGDQAAGQSGTAQAPSDAEIAERSKKLLENQHHNDAALEQYERIEHHVDRTGGAAPRVLDDKTYRVVPTGSGTMKLLLKDGERPVDPADYRKQLTAWVELLELMLKPDDPRTKSANAKWQKRKDDRKELLDTTRDAFLTKWDGQETCNGRVCDVYEVQPNPNFHPRSIVQDILTRVTAKIWVDRDANQLVRGEAHVMRDISFGGGILGKLYRGGVFFMEQREVSPGIWLPTRYQYDYTARKFLFMFEEHQYVEAREYRHIGPPKQALAMAQKELASGKAVYGDP